MLDPKIILALPDKHDLVKKKAFVHCTYLTLGDGNMCNKLNDMNEFCAWVDKRHSSLHGMSAYTESPQCKHDIHHITA